VSAAGPGTERAGGLHYVDGIDAPEAGDFKRAVASLTRAIEADGDNADHHRARGVANTLAEDFRAAISDLQRALKLRPGDREARLWLAAAYRMNNEAQTGAQFFTHGREVPAEYASLVYNEMAMEYLTSRYQGQYWDRETRRRVQVPEPIRRRFPDAARAYAQRHKATGQDAGEAVVARMKSSVARGDCPAAMKDLAVLRRSAPEDAELRGYWAACLLAVGDVLVWNGPRGGGESLRPQSHGERQAELARAIAAADAALAIDPRHVNSMATKALALSTLGRTGEAEALADRGLAIEPRNVRLLQLKARFLANAAASLEARAAALRAGRTETSRERRSDGIYEVTKHYPPTAAELAQAASLEAEAHALRQRAAKLSSDAKHVEAVLIPSLLKEGDAKLATRDDHGGRRLFEQAYAYQPDHDAIAPRLAEVAKRLGDSRQHRVFALLAEPMRGTTAAAELQTAWDHALRTAWNAAAEALDRAANIDPADAGAPAYRSVVAAGQSDAGSAAHARRAALALEEARARLMGSTFAGEGGPVDIQEAGLSLIVRLVEGNALLGRREYDLALATFAPKLALETRMAKERLVELVPSAMLPEAVDAGVVPEAPSLASLLAWSRLGTGRALIALGRPADAHREFRAVRASLASWPSTATGRETMYVVDSWSRLGLAEAAYAARDYDAAFRLLMSGEGWPGRLPAELEQQRRALSEKVVEARKRLR